MATRAHTAAQDQEVAIFGKTVHIHNQHADIVQVHTQAQNHKQVQVQQHLF